MIVTSTVVMFGLVYLNTHALDHIWFSQMRAWMPLLMGATMAVLMLGFMRRMYDNCRVNFATIVASVAVIASAL